MSDTTGNQKTLMNASSAIMESAVGSLCSKERASHSAPYSQAWRAEIPPKKFPGRFPQFENRRRSSCHCICRRFCRRGLACSSGPAHSMNIKLDENLPLRLAPLLKDLGHEVHTLQDERLIGHADREIWEAAQKESRFLITQDLDFSDSLTVCSWVSPTASCSYAFTRRTEGIWLNGSVNYFKRKTSASGLTALSLPRNGRFAC